ncbi:MAG TPA: Dabb family protein [Methanotrichaceae archaeon]|nr:Dabb family protein [Methanotrichaceae archaeon]
MMRHIVMFKMKESAEGADKSENLNKVRSGLESLVGKIPEIRSFDVGQDILNTALSYDLVLCSEFESKDDLFRYQKHPEHVKIAELVGRVCANRIVVDYTV